MGNTLRLSTNKTVLSFFIISLVAIKVWAINPTIVATMPSTIFETSGLAIAGQTGFWTHNDGYGDERLYNVGMNGAITRTIDVLGTTNQDWEDLAQDQQRTTLYIGDFGNNANNRTDLRIYKMPHPSNISGSTVTPDVIHFSYPDQQDFPAQWMNYDCEGFFHFNNKLFLFSKSAGDAIGYTKMYSLPDQPGTYVATLVDSFFSGDRSTAADISQDGKNVVIMSNSRIHIFKNFVGEDFFGGQYTLITMGGGWTQKEAISFSSNNEVFITDEDIGNGPTLYYVDLSPWIPTVVTTGISKNQAAGDFSVFPNPANSHFTAKFSGPSLSSSALKLYDMTGQLVREVAGGVGQSTLRMETANLPAGVYFYKLYADNRETRTARLVINH
ncbi:MAG: T9SS type A sorting domain-containing protein [Bacteroidia bacterium]|nr:T9SS type A sorting domain-containing protein [Bacteroidia bacterium]